MTSPQPRSSYEIDWTPAASLLPRLEKAKALGYKLTQSIFAGYRENGGGIAAFYRLTFRKVKE